MNNPDKFFKQKLEDAHVSPRPGAWNRVEANLSKKNNGLAWLRIAAALLLPGLLTTTILYLQTGTEQKQIATHPKVTTPDTAKTIQSPHQNIESVTVNRTPGNPVTAPRSIKEHQERNETNLQPVLNEREAQLVIAEKNEIKNELDTIRHTAVAAAPVEKPIVIEYVLAPISHAKKDAPEVAEVAERKTGLQRALEFAREAKNSDNPLGGLRQVKDDLFALDFKKEKQKKQ